MIQVATMSLTSESKLMDRRLTVLSLCDVGRCDYWAVFRVADHVARAGYWTDCSWASRVRFRLPAGTGSSNEQLIRSQSGPRRTLKAR